MARQIAVCGSRLMIERTDTWLATEVALMNGVLRTAVLVWLSCGLLWAADQPRPNVLLIVVDDMRVELGCYGSDVVKSPNIDRLAARGLRFERAYCQQAVCNPSRASMLTGLRPETLGIWNLQTHFREVVPDIVTLPQWFRQQGYQTIGIGKIFHNFRQPSFRGDALSWSQPATLHYGSHGDDQATVSGTVPPDLLTLPRAEMREVPDQAYSDGRIADLAVQSLAQLKSEPFFLAVGFWKPHLPFNAPKKYWDQYSLSDIHPPSPAATPRDVPTIALHDSRELLRGFRDRPDGKPTAEEVLALRHGYYAGISYVDAQIGKVLAALDEHDLTNNTIIVFCSDHGFHLGEHDLWAKTSNFELDARVPMIIASPSHRTQAEDRRSTTALVELLDIYPTLTDLCGLPMPSHLEGNSLRPLLRDPAASVKSAAYTWHPRPAYPATGKDPEVMGHSVRSPRYRYTEWRDYRTNAIRARELYDHQTDDGETINLADLPEQAGVVATMQRYFAAKESRRAE